MVEQFLLHNRIGFKVTSLARIMESRLERALKEHEVTRMMWCVMRGVGMEDVKTPSELAGYIGVARPAVSRLLKSMEERGYLNRANGGGDGRVSALELTPLGLEKMKTCHVLVRELNEHFASKLDEEAYASFMRAVELLSDGEDEVLMRL